MTNNRGKNHKNFLDHGLNAQQKKAVTHKAGSILVIAGAGSGKTRVITTRIADLIVNKNVLPSSIIGLTFTNKAANEMKKRIAQFLDGQHEVPFIGTFHSYCLRLLKQHAELIETPFFSILDEDDKKKLINGILHRNNLQKQIGARQAAYQISQIKNKMVDLTKISAHHFTHPLMHKIYIAYEEEKTASKCLDFDDLLLQTVKLFKKNRTFKTDFQERIRHILVDEYQDTNVVQHELLKQMATRNKKQVIDSICAVGDEDQSIYSWRGATVANILNFQKDFSKTKVIKIEQNYRSVQPILDVANHVIKHNVNRNPKSLWSEKKGRDRIRLISCLSEYQEGDAIVQLIKTAQKKTKPSSVAVLYRTHAQSRAIEEALIKNSIPYKIIGGIQFYERKEIKDILAYLRLIVNPFDRTSFFRVINCPARGLGAKFEEQFYTHWHEQPFLTFAQVAQHLIDSGALPKTKQTALKEFIAIFENLNPHDKPSKAVEQIIARAAYLHHVKKMYEKQEAQTRIENIKELLSAIKHFESEKISTIEQFLDEVALMQDKMATRDNEQEKVLLMTLHSAKGLEFDIVILAGLEQGLLPTSRALDEDDSLEEERRLFYVGITRAKERLLLTHTKFRYTYGQMTDQFTSQFLDELPDRLVTHEDCSYFKQIQLQTFFADWLGVKERSTVFTFSGAQAITRQKKAPKISRNTIKKPTHGMWKKNQPVMHKTYGMGIVQKVEEKSDKKYITVKFRSGIKKIVDQFLQII